MSVAVGVLCELGIVCYRTGVTASLYVTKIHTHTHTHVSTEGAHRLRISRSQYLIVSTAGFIIIDPTQPGYSAIGDLGVAL